MFRDVGALAFAPSNADGGAEEGAEEGASGDAAAAFPALPRGLDLSLAGDSKNDGDRRRLSVFVHRGTGPWGRRKTWALTAPPQLVPWNAREDGQGGGKREKIIEAWGDEVGEHAGPVRPRAVPAGGDRGLGRAESCASAVAWFWSSWTGHTVVAICARVMEGGGGALEEGRAGSA